METIIKVEGLDQITKGLTDEALGKVLRKFLTSVTAYVQRQAASHAPVDTGRLRGALTQPSAVTVAYSGVYPLWAEIKPLVGYSAYVEHGTAPHWTGIGNLAGWAHRHGINPYAIQRAIAKYGTKAHPFMQPAIDDLEAAIPEFITALEADIRQMFSSGGEQ